MKACIMDADYETDEKANKPVIKLSCIDEKGKSLLILDEFKPYLYALYKNNIEKKIKKISMVTGIEKVKRKFGHKEKFFLKVYVDIPSNATKAREEIKKYTKCYEYNINFYKRYMIDNKLYPLDWIDVRGKETKNNTKFNKIIKSEKITKTTGPDKKPKIIAFDIETVDDKIAMISIAAKNQKKVLTYRKASNATALKNEKEMLIEFESVVNKLDPDIIATYNGDSFDFDFIRKRLEHHKIGMKIGRDNESFSFVKRARTESARIFGRVHIDLFQFINNILSPQLQSEVLTLRDVSNELIGKTKDALSVEEIIDLWKNDVSSLADYCLNDSLLTKKLAESLINQIFSLSRISGQLPFDVSRLTYGLLVEWFLIRKASELKIISPNNPYWGEIQNRRSTRPYRGGFVKEPVVGLHNDIAVFDFRSLYPSIIVTYNISPDTLNSGRKKIKVPESKNFFCAEKKGFIPTVLKQIIDERAKALPNDKNALKILANAVYGYLAYPGARFYSKECAEAAAAFGRKNIMKSISLAEKNGFDVIYSDTDSLFVKGNNAIKFLKKINKSLPGIIKLELQGVYKRGLFVPQRLGKYTAKKRYALLDKKNNMTIRGFEAVRRDWCTLARNLQHKILYLVLNRKEKEAVKETRNVVKKIKSRSISIKDIAIKTVLRKTLSEYKTIGPHVAVAKKLQAEGRTIKKGMIISYVVTKGKSKKISDRAEPSNDVELKNYDIDYYLNNQIISVALRVLSTLGYKEEDFANNLKKYV